jgi:hypothetical protein
MKGIVFAFGLFGFGFSLRRDVEGGPIGVWIHWRETIDNMYDTRGLSEGLWWFNKRIADLYL